MTKGSESTPLFIVVLSRQKLLSLHILQYYIYNCLVLVRSRNGFERDLHKQKNAGITIELKIK